MCDTTKFQMFDFGSDGNMNKYNQVRNIHKPTLRNLKVQIKMW